jgi:uridine kinase
LVKIDSSIKLVAMGDFYLPSHLRLQSKAILKPIGADYDWRRMKEQVLKQLITNRAGYYPRYDWNTDRLADWQIVPVGGMVIIEGIYVLRKELADFYDYKIWVDCPREIRLARGIERDGESARETWESNWMVAEDKYVREQSPFERADLVVDGS